MRAGHHLIWLGKDGTVAGFAAAQTPLTLAGCRSQTLRQVLATHPELRRALRLQLRPPSKPVKGDPEHAAMLRSIRALSQGTSVNLMARRKLLHAALRWGALPLLQVLQRHMDGFAPVLTPLYREILPLLATKAAPRDGLLFHAARPNLYLWQPVQNTAPEQLLVCFTTLKNSLNLPLPLAHSRLTEAGRAVLYVYTGADHPSEGPAPGWDISATADLIKTLASEAGYKRLFALGTSLGGYTACRYARELPFERVLNFSGAAGRLDENLPPELAPGAWAGSFDQNKILSVLSRGDVTDQRILAAYRQSGFDTQHYFLDAAQHGSFGAAWVSGDLQALIAWLFEGRALEQKSDTAPPKQEGAKPQTLRAPARARTRNAPSDEPVRRLLLSGLSEQGRSRIIEAAQLAGVFVMHAPRTNGAVDFCLACGLRQYQTFLKILPEQLRIRLEARVGVAA